MSKLIEIPIDVRKPLSQVVRELGLSVGHPSCKPCQSIKPFGGKTPSGLSVGAIGPGGSGGGAGSGILDALARFGIACEPWGAPLPAGSSIGADGCIRGKRVCGAIAPFGVSVAAAATAQAYTLFAKNWFWPLFWVDNSHADVDVVGLTYQGDPVFENGTGSTALTPNNIFDQTSFYGFVPGLPAFSNTTGLVFSLANSNAAAQVLEGVFVGISIRS